MASQGVARVIKILYIQVYDVGIYFQVWLSMPDMCCAERTQSSPSNFLTANPFSPR